MVKNNILASGKKSKKKSELLDKIKNNELTMKFTMNMPVSLHQDLKILAAKERVNMVDIILPMLSTLIQKKA